MWVSQTKFEKNLKSFGHEVDEYTSHRFLEKTKEKWDLHEKKCYKDANNDEYKYADCMTEATQKLLDEERKLNYKQQYLQSFLYECFTLHRDNLTELEQCKDYCRNMIKGFYEDYLKDF